MDYVVFNNWSGCFGSLGFHAQRQLLHMIVTYSEIRMLVGEKGLTWREGKGDELNVGRVKFELIDA